MNALTPTLHPKTAFDNLDHPTPDDAAFRKRRFQTAPVLGPSADDSRTRIVLPLRPVRVTEQDPQASHRIAPMARRCRWKLCLRSSGRYRRQHCRPTGNNGSLESLSRRIVHSVFGVLSFELGESVAKGSFFGGHGLLLLENVSGLLGLLHENCLVRLYSGTPPGKASASGGVLGRRKPEHPSRACRTEKRVS